MLKSIKLYLVTGGLIFLASMAYPQKFIVSAEYGIGTFHMKDLKKLQHEFNTNFYFKAEEVEKFPPYMGYGLSAQYCFSSGYTIGIESDLFSTGGRNYIEDYSGYYKIDFLAHAINVGILTGFKTTINKKLSYGFEINQGLKFSSLDIKEKIVISDFKRDDELNSRSVSWFIKPLLRLNFNISEMLALGVFAGGELNFNSKLHLADDRDIKIKHPFGDEAKINWSGLRSGISLSILL